MRLSSVFAIAAMVLFPGCVPVLIGAGAGAAYSSLEDRRAGGAQLDDEGIELRTANRVSDRYGDTAHVNVTSYNRSVLLTGEVPDADARAAVERIARAVPNVRGVNNELEIAGTSSLTARTNDSFITSKVKARFLDARRFNPIHVKVVTEAGVVYLLGTVTEREADDAVELARTMAGVRKVVKILEYCQPTDPICRHKAADPKKPKPAA